MAGINAACAVQGRDPLILQRDQAYIGVLIDDLVTRDIKEPYRMFTSRAEHRLLLRGDNADLRLTPIAAELGLVNARRANAVANRQDLITHHADQLRGMRVFPSAATNQALTNAGMQALSRESTAAELLARPEARYQQLQQALALDELTNNVIETLEIEMKYGGYLIKQQRQVDRAARMERHLIPATLDVMAISGLRNEAKQVLSRFKPATIGQASRLAGITPADVSVLILAIEKQK